MKRVTLICTEHIERGRVNVSELCAILERVQPEVIFLEVPSEVYDAYMALAPGLRLELDAVRKYRGTHHVELIPVDAPTPGEDFFQNHKRLVQRVEQESCEFCQLHDSNRVYVRQYGFAYLNSDHCDRYWSDSYSEMSGAVRRIGEPDLTEIFKLWCSTNDSREQTMLEKIETYCCDNSFGKAVFLVGAAHRRGIMEKVIRRLANELCAKIEWDFDAIV